MRKMMNEGINKIDKAILKLEDLDEKSLEHPWVKKSTRLLQECIKIENEFHGLVNEFSGSEEAEKELFQLQTRLVQFYSEVLYGHCFKKTEDGKTWFIRIYHAKAIDSDEYPFTKIIDLDCMKYSSFIQFEQWCVWGGEEDRYSGQFDTHNFSVLPEIQDYIAVDTLEFYNLKSKFLAYSPDMSNFHEIQIKEVDNETN